jgi:hypothetical protein
VNPPKVLPWRAQKEQKDFSVDLKRAIAGTETVIRAVSVPAISFFGFLRVFVP